MSAGEFLERWVEQNNYPEVAVLFEEQNGKQLVKFKQARFLLTEVDEEDPTVVPNEWK